MPLPPRNIHFFWAARNIEQRQLIAELVSMFGLDTGLRARAEESLDPLVSKAPNHANTIVLRNATLYVIISGRGVDEVAGGLKIGERRSDGAVSAGQTGLNR